MRNLTGREKKSLNNAFNDSSLSRNPAAHRPRSVSGCVKFSPDFLTHNKAALALYEYAKQNADKSLLELIYKDYERLDYQGIFAKMFYDASYTDYLFSLPMGAGKTYLMAAFIYLDLYFAMNEPSNKAFAHNFLILAPSGLKSSILPSLRNIEHFNPSWILPEPSASEIKSLIKFEILNENKSDKKATKPKTQMSLK